SAPRRVARASGAAPDRTLPRLADQNPPPDPLPESAAPPRADAEGDGAVLPAPRGRLVPSSRAAPGRRELLGPHAALPRDQTGLCVRPAADRGPLSRVGGAGAEGLRPRGRPRGGGRPGDLAGRWTRGRAMTGIADPKLLFVVGCPRSGTTWLQLL